jgi:hypothetical protein
MANRTDNARIQASVTIAGVVKQLGIFEDRKGGDSDSASVVVNRGGMGVREAAGGKQEPENITISRVRDDLARSYEKELRAGVGRLRIQITEQALDDEGAEVPNDKTTWSGRIKKVGTTDRTEEGNAIEMLEIESVVETVS